MATITEVVRDKVADAINRARYQGGDGTGLAERGLADEDASGQEYSRRLALAAIEAMREFEP